MKRFLKKYEIQIETIGPVHIGSGEAIRKNQWLLDRAQGKAVIPDPRLMFDLLDKRDLLGEYEEYMLRERPEPLHVWLRNHSIGQKDIYGFAKYVLSTDGLDLRDQKILRDMQMAVKDAYGFPYIPGSSLKGALRNVLLAEKLHQFQYNDTELVEEIRTFRGGNSKRYLKRQAETLETEVFHTKGKDSKARDAVNDVMSGIRVADSNSVGLDKLTLCQKIDMRKSGTEGTLPLIRECIKPGTKLCFDLTIDTTETEITVDEIKGAINHFLRDYNEMFLKAFKDEELYHENVIYLGGGVGFPSKTVLNQALESRRNRVELVSRSIDNVLPNSMKRHSRDKTLGVSPSVAKLTEFDGSLMQMGPCRIDIIPI